MPRSFADGHPYWQEGLGSPLVLYEGPIVVRLGDDDESMDGHVELNWLPSPTVRVSVASQKLLRSAFADDSGEPSFAFPDDLRLAQVNGSTWEDNPSGHSTRSTTGIQSQLVGHDEPVRAVVLNLINFEVSEGRGIVPKADGGQVGQARYELGEWIVTVESTIDYSNITDYLKRTALYAFTHRCSIERADGERFVWDDTSPVRDVLFHGFGFAQGSLVGLALPVGFSDDGVPVWSRWECTTCDRGKFVLSWCDSSHQARLLGPVLAGLWGRFQDPFWAAVTKRAIRYFIEANQSDPLDVAIPTAQTGLEILSWAVLEQEGWLERGEGGLDAAGRIRLLLKWAGIPSEIPATLTQLMARSKAFGAGLWDGPRVLTHVRRDVVHAPKKGPEWPESPALHDAWRLATWYLELVLLRVAGYTGEYGSRLHVPMWHGSVEPVPWADVSP